MPKIIKNIEENIINAALELFGDEGYEAVDMKMIAQKSGIAVGTLYNYYHNKEQLFLSAFEKSWQKTFDRLESINDIPMSSIEKLKKYIEILYQDIERRKGLGNELAKVKIIDLKDNEKIINYKDKLIHDIDKLVKSSVGSIRFNKGYDYSIRLAETLFMAISIMILQHPNEKEQNIDYLNEIINTFTDKKI